MRPSHKFLIILCLSGTALSLPASADEVPPAVAAMLANIERQTSVKPSYESITTAGDGTVTIAKLALNKPATDADPSMTMRVDETRLADIKDLGNGLYEIGQASFTNINGDISGPDMAVTFEVPEGHAEGYFVKQLGDNPSNEEIMRDAMTLARKTTIGPMNVAAMGQKFTVEGYDQTWDGDPATGAGSYSMSVRNIAIPEKAIAMVDQAGMLKQLGYGGLNIDLKSDGKTDIKDGKLDMTMNLAVNSRDMGSLTLGVVGGGLPMTFFADMRKLEAGNQAQAGALVSQLAGVSFSSLSLRFDDASITGKLLPMIAAMQGMSPEQLVATAGPMLQMGLMQLQSPAFAEQASKAVNSFLLDPKSFTIAARPATPVSAAELQTMNPSAPGEVITRLGLSVSAND